MGAAYKTILALYLTVLLWLVLFKFSLDASSVLAYQERTLNLTPFAYSASLRNPGMDTALNFVAFIPFGLLLRVVFKQSDLWRKLALICLFSLAVETAQFIFAIGVADITDVLTNTFGGLFGLALYGICHRYIDTKKLDRLVAVITAGLLMVLLSILLSRTIGFQSVPNDAAPRLQLDCRQADTVCIRPEPSN